MTPMHVFYRIRPTKTILRAATVSWIELVRAKWSWESDPDNTEEPNSPTRLTRDQFREREALPAETLLNHLNDTHFHIREGVADTLRWIFMNRVSDWQAENPNKNLIERPRDFDWVRSDWQRRVTTQKAWRNWWKQNGAAKAAPTAPKGPQG